MIRFLKKKHVNRHDLEKFLHLKRECRLIIRRLIAEQEKHQAYHCVLVVGQPESGKSTFCSAHMQHLFPIFESSSPLEINTHAFDIYLHKKTLFLDLSKEFFLFNDAYFSERLWRILGVSLKKCTDHLLLTKTIICIDLQDFLTRTQASNKTRLTQISMGLMVLAKQLKSPIDINIFFTKTDLIPGCIEFFQHETQEFLEQAWGLSLDNNTEEYFSTEFDELIKILNSRLLWNIHHEIRLEKLHLIKSFPILIETMKERIKKVLPEFLQQLTSSRYLCPSRLYLISCRQYREWLETPMTKEKSIKIDYSDDKHKNFFTVQALENICRYQQKNKFITLEKVTRSIFLLLCSLIFIAIVTQCSKHFSEHIRLISSERNIIHSSLIFSEQPVSSLTLKTVSDELYKIENVWRKMHESNNMPLFDRYIFTRDIKSDSQLKQLYQRILMHQWLPLVSEQLKNDINAQLSHSPEKAYITFSVYMMLTQPEWHIDSSLIQRHAQFLLKGARIPMLSFLENIQKNIVLMDESSLFIKKTRNSFFELAPNKLAYILLFSSIDKNSVIDIDQCFDKKNRLLIIDKKYSLINTIYTKEGFETIYQKRLSTIAHEAIYGNPVLGKFTRQNENASDLLALLQEEYLKLYSNAWENAIESIQLQKTGSLEALAEQLDIITSINSPILTLLNLARKNTHIPQIEQSSPFLTTFNNTLTKESTPSNNALYRSFSLLIKLHERIISLKTERDVCLLLADENAATPQNPTEAKQLSLLATQLPNPIQTWLQEISDSYFRLLNQQKNKC